MTVRIKFDGLNAINVVRKPLSVQELLLLSSVFALP